MATTTTTQDGLTLITGGEPAEPPSDQPLLDQCAQILAAAPGMPPAIVWAVVSSTAERLTAGDLGAVDHLEQWVNGWRGTSLISQVARSARQLAITECPFVVQDRPRSASVRGAAVRVLDGMVVPSIRAGARSWRELARFGTEEEAQRFAFASRDRRTAAGEDLLELAVFNEATRTAYPARNFRPCDSCCWDAPTDGMIARAAAGAPYYCCKGLPVDGDGAFRPKLDDAGTPAGAFPCVGWYLRLVGGGFSGLLAARGMAEDPALHARSATLAARLTDKVEETL